MTDKQADTRYPYTYACDLIRSWAGYGPEGTKLSRSEASQIRSKLASVLRLSDEEVSRKLADHYLEEQETITDANVAAYLGTLGRP